jgi:hypothetical protein
MLELDLMSASVGSSTAMTLPFGAEPEDDLAAVLLGVAGGR